MSEQIVDTAAPTSSPTATPKRGKLREPVLAAIGSLALAILMTWPTMKNPATTIPQDIYDPLLVAWSLGWGGHALLSDPLNLWNANAFYPESNSYAFTDSLLGYFPFGFIGDGPAAALVRYNVVYVFAAALAFFGAYILARQLGSRWPGAIVAGAAFAYAPWRLSQAGHLHVMSSGGIPLAIAALLYGHGYSFRDGFRPERVKPGWAAVGWGIASWQIMIGFGIGLPFAYALALIGLAALIGWWVTGRPRIDFRLLGANMIGLAVFGLVSLFMALPYLRVVADHPYARRTEADLAFLSPPLHSFFIAPAQSLPWGDSHAPLREAVTFVPEMTMLPGFVLIILAIIGLTVSSWRVRHRVVLGVIAVVSLVFAMGTQFFGGKFTYLLLIHYLPGWDALRTPGRLVIYVTLALGLLAAGAVTRFGELLRERMDADPRFAHRAATLATVIVLIPGLLVLLEGTNRTPHPRVPAQPAALRDVEGPVLVLPSSPLADQAVMLWSTDGWPKIVNGGSGFTPQSTEEIRAATVNFPDATSVDYLQQRGIRTVVVLRASLPGTPWERAADRPVDGLPLERTEVGDAVVFVLDE